MYNLAVIAEQTGAESAAVMVPHPTEPYLYCKESINMPTEWSEIKNPLDKTTDNGTVYLSGDPYLAEHIDTKFAGHLISSVLIVPIQKKDTVLATLELIISSPDKAFKQGAQDAADKFAATLAEKL